MTTFVSATPPTAIAEPHAALRRFVTDGIRATLDAYTAGTLPLHRFTWELDTRLATLAELTTLPHHRTLALLRNAQRTVATIDTALRTTGRPALTATEEHSLTTALTTLRTGLARLDPTDPIDPVAPAVPAGTRPVVVAFRRRPRHPAAIAATAGLDEVALGGGHTAA